MGGASRERGVQTGEKGEQSSSCQEAWRVKVRRDLDSQPPSWDHGGLERARGLLKAIVLVPGRRRVPGS